MRQHIMALIKRGMRPSAAGSPPILHVDTIIGVVAANPSRVFKIKLGLTTGDAKSIAYLNPFGVPALVGLTVLHVVTGSSTNTVDIGVSADDETPNDILLDGAGIGTAQNASIVNNIAGGGTNGKAAQLLSATQYITATLSTTSTGLDAYLYVTLTPVTS